MEGEGLFGKEKVSTHGIQRTSMQRKRQESINISLSQAQSFHPKLSFISRHSPLLQSLSLSLSLSFSRCYSNNAEFHYVRK